MRQIQVRQPPCKTATISVSVPYYTATDIYEVLTFLMHNFNAHISL